MISLILALLLFSGCAQPQSADVVDWGARDLKIMVLGHVYDDQESGYSRVLSFIQSAAPDFVVFGGDSIVGPQRDDAADLAPQWAGFGAFRALILARTFLVGGNHDAWGSFGSIRDRVLNAFIAEGGETGRTLLVKNYDKLIGLHFVFTGDGQFPASRMAPFSAKFGALSENLVFGGHRDNIPGLVETLNSSTAGRFSYFSGDHQVDNRPIRLAHVDAYNVTTFCAAGMDADMITVGAGATRVEHLGGCGR